MIIDRRRISTRVVVWKLPIYTLDPSGIPSANSLFLGTTSSRPWEVLSSYSLPGSLFLLAPPREVFHFRPSRGLIPVPIPRPSRPACDSTVTLYIFYIKKLIIRDLFIFLVLFLYNIFALYIRL